MRTANVRFAGVDITAVPSEFRTRLPDGHYNFFEVPWNMSCPGYGLVLVTGQQLAAIQSAAHHDTGDDLELLVEGGDDNEQTVLKNIFMVKATQVWGENMRTGGLTPEGNLQSIGDLADTPFNMDGLWFLELQDKRNYWLRTTQNPLSTGVFNVTTGVSKFVEETAKSDVEAYTDKEILSLLCPQMTLSSDPNNSLDQDTKLRDVFVVGLPTPIAADLILHHRGKGEVFKFDATSPDARFNVCKIDDNTQDLLSLIFPYRITGGSCITYQAFENQPAIVGYRNKLGTKSDYSDYYEPQIGGRWAILTDNTKPKAVGSSGGEGGQSIPTYHHRGMYHALYRGFQNACLLDYVPVSLVKFNWHNSVPSTEIHIGQQSPIRTMLEGPTGRFLAEHPLPINFNGQIGLPFRPTEGFRGEIKLCNFDEGWALVLPEGVLDFPENRIKVGLIPKTWHRGGDSVRVVPVSGKWEIDTEIDGFRSNPPVGAQVVNGPARTDCQDDLPA